MRISSDTISIRALDGGVVVSGQLVVPQNDAGEFLIDIDDSHLNGIAVPEPVIPKNANRQVRENAKRSAVECALDRRREQTQAAASAHIDRALGSVVGLDLSRIERATQPLAGADPETLKISIVNGRSAPGQQASRRAVISFSRQYRSKQ